MSAGKAAARRTFGWVAARPGRTPFLGVTVVIGVLIVAGLAAAVITITKSPTELGIGNNATRGSISWWTWAAVAPTDVPATVPAAVSLAVATPTVLPAANTSYRVNAAAAGDEAVLWNFSEATGGTLNTELEIVFVVVNGTSPVTTTVTIFVETQAAAPTGPFTFSFFLDMGTGPSLLRSELQYSNQCTALHTCP